jgi:phenylacetate-coenzyme A ligase PaaK-like adenylate-forming protein
VKATNQLRVAWGIARALRSQYWSAERIAAWQAERLVRMMRHAVLRVPFYRALGLPADSLRSVADLARFPVLRKADVQRAGNDLIAAGFDPATLRSSRTSGSSGEPTTTWFDQAAWLQSRYVLKARRLLAVSGCAPGQRVLIVSEARPEELAGLSEAAPRGGLLYRQRFVSIHAPLEQHLELMRAWRPTALYAFPSWLAELLDVAAAQRAQLPRIPVVYTSSEVLTPGLRARVAEALDERGAIDKIGEEQRVRVHATTLGQRRSANSMRRTRSAMLRLPCRGFSSRLNRKGYGDENRRGLYIAPANCA